MDYFPPQQRGTAMALLTMGASAVGWLLGVGVGGYFTAAHGWRSAFLMAGGPGLVLALVVHFVLAEPRERLDNSAARVRAEGLLEALSHLRRKRSFVLALAGSSAYLIFGYGIAVFLPSFMIRTFHATVTQVSGTWGCTIAAADAIGGLIGGWMADRLGTRDVRWYMWLPAVTCALGVPLYVLALTAHTAQSFIVLDFVAECTLSIGYPVFFVAVQAICGGRRRTMASATAQFAGILVGSGLGPLMAGALSDAFDSQYSSESLRHSLMVMTVFLIPAAIAFYWASRTLPLELEE
jgi:MFS family permease